EAERCGEGVAERPRCVAESRAQRAGSGLLGRPVTRWKSGGYPPSRACLGSEPDQALRPRALLGVAVRLLHGWTDCVTAGAAGGIVDGRSRMCTNPASRIFRLRLAGQGGRHG